jgi:hypothetical protein
VISWSQLSILKGRTIWIVDVQRGNGKRIVVQAGEKLTAFLELESSIRAQSRRIVLTTSQEFFVSDFETGTSSGLTSLMPRRF